MLGRFEEEQRRFVARTERAEEKAVEGKDLCESRRDTLSEMGRHWSVLTRQVLIAFRRTLFGCYLVKDHSRR